MQGACIAGGDPGPLAEKVAGIAGVQAGAREAGGEPVRGHLYLPRAYASAQLYGSPAQHIEQLAAAAGLA